MLDRAVLARCIHGLEDQQHSPIVLGVKHVLKLGEHVDADGQGVLGLRLIFGGQVEGVAGIDVLQTEFISVTRNGSASLRAFLISFFMSWFFIISLRPKKP